MDETTVEVLPPVNPVIARGVLIEVDDLIDWQKSAVKKAEKAGIRLARLIADVGTNNYWMVRGFSSEREYVAQTFPQSESQYYILRRIGTALRIYPAVILEEIGISKCQDLVRVHNQCGTIGANWFLWAKSETRDTFRQRVRAFLGKALPPAKEDDGDVFITYKVWKDAIPIMQMAQEISALESGSENKSNNYILREAEFCAGHNENGSRTKGNNALALTTIELLIGILDMDSDPSVLDRLIGSVRRAVEEKKR